MQHALHLDPRSPLVLDTHDLARRPGSMRRLHRTVAAPEMLGSAVIGVPAGSDLELDLLFEAVAEGILVSGSVHGTAVGECVRCLDEVVDDIDVSIQELYLYPDRAAVAVQDGDEEEYLELDGDLVDVEPAIRDAVVPALPFQPLCRSDCPGLCPQCGARLADHPGHTHDTTDPRWAALGGLASTSHDERES